MRGVGIQGQSALGTEPSTAPGFLQQALRLPGSSLVPPKARCWGVGPHAVSTHQEERSGERYAHTDAAHRVGVVAVVLVGEIL